MTYCLYAGGGHYRSVRHHAGIQSFSGGIRYTIRLPSYRDLGGMLPHQAEQASCCCSVAAHMLHNLSGVSQTEMPATPSLPTNNLFLSSRRGIPCLKRFLHPFRHVWTFRFTCEGPSRPESSILEPMPTDGIATIRRRLVSWYSRTHNLTD
jgi:hypothetical protein